MVDTAPIYKDKVLIYFPEKGNTVEIDCTEKIDYSKASRTSKHKVESGSEITDHVIEENFILTVTGIVSSAYEGREYRPAEVKEVLYFHAKNKSKCSVITKDENYDNIVMTNFAKSQNPDDAEDLNFTINFEEIRTAWTKTTKEKPTKKNIENKPSKKKDSQARNQQKTNKGKVALAPLSTSDLNQATQVASTGIDGVSMGNLLGVA